MTRRFPVFFVPFVHRLSGYLAAGAFGQSDYRVGQVVYRDIRRENASEAVLQVPGGEPRTIWPQQRGLQSVWPVGVVDAPGLWEIFARERVSDRFAVQTDEREPDLTPVPMARLEALFGKDRLRVLDGKADLKEAILSQRHGQELWRWVLLAALVAMGAEMPHCAVCAHEPRDTTLTFVIGARIFFALQWASREVPPYFI